MATVSKTAGAAGSITITTRNTAGQLVTPVSAPTVVWYTDSGRTAGAVTLSVTGSGSSYTASWTAGQAPASAATRYLQVAIEVSSGVFDTDADDDVSFVDAGSSIVTTDYTDLTTLKAFLGISDTVDDTALSDAITEASRQIDADAGTTFYPITEARYFEPQSPFVVRVDRFCTTSGLTVQTGVDGTYPTTLTLDTDYLTYPYNAVARGDAFRALRSPNGLLPSGFGRPTVKVTATWGTASVPDVVAKAALIKAAQLFRRKDTPEGVAGSSEFGVVRISRTEDPDYLRLLRPWMTEGFA